jgi:lipopolysaccharide/colanic/teichoic acid biosynthesis glycosyltransferase
LNNSNLDLKVTTAAAVTSEVNYGVASGVTLENKADSSSALSLSFADYVNYLFVEYFKGILFVALSIFFIFAVPSLIAKPSGVKGMLRKALKRGIDILGALIGLILTLPLWLVLPILIKLDSPGPVFYTQLRVGINRRKRERRYHQRADVTDRRARERRRENYMGKPFKVYKFRTMINDAERETGPVWATKNDSRITRVGAFLRKTRMDEIPQFINVLKGDMSLVGPRPERPSFVRELNGKIENYAKRLEVKPGLTGLAQVENGYDASVDTVHRKIKYDLEYIGNWSLWTDLKILAKTVIVVLTGKGAC